MRIDHLILAVDDLDAAARRIEEQTGLASVAGGVHPAWGTRNRIVPLGGAYLELVAVADPVVAGEAVFGRLVAAGASRGEPALVGWAVEPDDFDAAIRRAGVQARRGARERPDGGLLSWSMAGADEALPQGLPFFLRWDDEASNPARATARHHGVAPTGIAWVEGLPHPDADLDAWLGHGHGLGVRSGATPGAAVALAGGGELRL